MPHDGYNICNKSEIHMIYNMFKAASMWFDTFGDVRFTGQLMITVLLLPAYKFLGINIILFLLVLRIYVSARSGYNIYKPNQPPLFMVLPQYIKFNVV